VAFKGAVSPEELDEDEDYEVAVGDLAVELSLSGKIVSMEVPRLGRGRGTVFAKYENIEGAVNAVAGFRCRTFDGIVLHVTFVPEAAYDSKAAWGGC
jgi:hypothetical protein